MQDDRAAETRQRRRFSIPSLKAMLPAILCVVLVGDALAQQPRGLWVSVHVGGSADLDACTASGSVVGLDPRGDNFLSVRSGPGGPPYKEADRINTGQRVAICEEKGAWLGVVYSLDRQDCGVATPRPKRSVYTGPCRSGWVHGRYVGDRAG
jgi:hypothetical protein